MVQNLRHATVGGKQLSKTIGAGERALRYVEEEEDNYF